MRSPRKMGKGRWEAVGQGLKLETEGGILGDKHKKKRQRRGKRRVWHHRSRWYRMVSLQKRMIHTLRGILETEPERFHWIWKLGVRWVNFLSEILLGEISCITQVEKKKPDWSQLRRWDEDTGKVDHSLQHFDTEGGKRIRDLENSWRAALNWRLPLNLCIWWKIFRCLWWRLFDQGREEVLRIQAKWPQHFFDGEGWIIYTTGRI